MNMEYTALRKWWEALVDEIIYVNYAYIHS